MDLVRENGKKVISSVLANNKNINIFEQVVYDNFKKKIMKKNIMKFYLVRLII